VLELARELPREARDGTVMRAFTATHRGSARVRAIFSKRAAGPIRIDLTVSRATRWVLDLFD